jgi:tungstate transport system substrate-binding protein
MLNCRWFLAITASIIFGTSAFAETKSIVVASTISMQDSGLFDHILPLFKAESGIDVKVMAQDTGLALDTGRRGNADVVFVHTRSAEEKFLTEGSGVRRYPVMYNDFVLIGPKSDPAGLKGSHDIVAALKRLKAMREPFIARGGRSGTNVAELDLWRLAGIDIGAEKATWYMNIGQGTGGALDTASAINAYVLSDRASWLSFKNKIDLIIVMQGDKRLLNQYDVMLVNPLKHPQVKKVLGQQFIDWLVSPAGQKAIGDYKINGEQLFHPNADDPQA